MLLPLLLALQTPAPPTPVSPVKVNAPAVGMSAPAPTSSDDKLICRNDARTGSRLSTRTCLKAREWRELEFQSQEWLRKQTPLPCATASCQE